eukprot:COSAG05_NODE_635_length_8192_cov_14.964043_9_plen_90_part_00
MNALSFPEFRGQSLNPFVSKNMSLNSGGDYGLPPDYPQIYRQQQADHRARGVCPASRYLASRFCLPDYLALYYLALEKVHCQMDSYDKL